MQLLQSNVDTHVNSSSSSSHVRYDSQGLKHVTITRGLVTDAPVNNDLETGKQPLLTLLSWCQLSCRESLHLIITEREESHCTEQSATGYFPVCLVLGLSSLMHTCLSVWGWTAISLNCSVLEVDPFWHKAEMLVYSLGGLAKGFSPVKVWTESVCGTGLHEWQKWCPSAHCLCPSVIC